MPVVQVPQFQGLAQQAMLDPVGAMAQQRTIQGQGLANQISGQAEQANQLDLNKRKGLLGIAFDQEGKLTPEGAATFAKVDPIGFHDYTLNAPVKEAEAAKAKYLSQLLSGSLTPGNQQAPAQGMQQAPQQPGTPPEASPMAAQQPAAQPVDFASKIKSLRSQVPTASIVGLDLSPQVEQAQREWWNSIRPQMQAIQDKYTQMGKNASPTEWATRVYNPMMNEVNRAIPAELQGLPEVKSFLSSDNFKQPPQPNNISFGMTGQILPQQKLNLEEDFRNDWSKEKKTYETQAQAFLNLMGAKNSKSYGSGVADQSLIDEFIRLQTGSAKPTQAQYNEALNTYGLGDMFDRLTGKMKDGAKLSPKQRDDIMNVAIEQMRNNQDRLLQNKSEKEGQLKRSGGDPANVFNSSAYWDKIGKYLEEPKPSNPANDPTFKTESEAKSALAGKPSGTGFWINGQHRFTK